MMDTNENMSSCNFIIRIKKGSCNVIFELIVMQNM